MRAGRRQQGPAVADEYFAANKKVEALCEQPHRMPADGEDSEMRKLRTEMYRRILGNGYCARPIELDCDWRCCVESIRLACEPTDEGTVALTRVGGESRDDDSPYPCVRAGAGFGVQGIPVSAGADATLSRRSPLSVWAIALTDSGAPDRFAPRIRICSAAQPMSVLRYRNSA